MLGSQNYQQEVDIWSLGCTFTEILNKEMAFQGQGEFAILIDIVEKIGVDEDWNSLKDCPNYMEFENFEPKKKLFNNENIYQEIILKMLKLNPKKRISIQ